MHAFSRRDVPLAALFGVVFASLSRTRPDTSRKPLEIAPRKITDGREDVDTLDDYFLEHSLWKNGTRRSFVGNPRLFDSRSSSLFTRRE
ncbi:hypothetical protein HZH68_014401 [Vespula germanica]|uniref:Uncharacterized protein n=1 Tax=Vespula germanica TaxID=30212 RepID=A0A834JAE4_VESGE|nr:hypothetical protein HZH68_014401 [Vespula germanica]